MSELDSKRRVVGLCDGEELEYDGLIVATGSKPEGCLGRRRQVLVFRFFAPSPTANGYTARFPAAVRPLR